MSKKLFIIVFVIFTFLLFFDFTEDLKFHASEYIFRIVRGDFTLKKQLYSKIIDEGKVYTVKEVSDELGIEESRAERTLDFLSSIDREIEQNGEFKGIEKVIVNGEAIYRQLGPSLINNDIFRDYDYRSPTQGSIDFSPKRTFFMVLTWVSMALEKAESLGIDNKKVVIARDCRKTSPEVLEAMIKAVEHTGLQAIYVGENPNVAATYAWSVRKHNPLMGMFFTASHVRVEDVAGFKVSILGKSGVLESLTTSEIKVVSRQRLDEILTDTNRLGLIQSEPVLRVADNDVESSYVDMATTVGLVAANVLREVSLYDLAVALEKAGDNILDVLGQYKEIISQDNKPLVGLRVVIEASHTPSGKIAAAVYRELGAEVVVLHEDVHELTGQHKADPSIIDNLTDLMDIMQEDDAHFGLAFDLDGDRGAIVVPVQEEDSVTLRNFTVLPSDNLMQALMPFYNQRGYNAEELGNIAVVRDVISTKAVDHKAEAVGYESYQTDSGYVFLKAQARELKEQGYVIPMYAERAGHSWTHVTGEFEDPIVVSLFFAIMGQEYIADHAESEHPFIEVFTKNTIPYRQSTRFQPLFTEELLQRLSDSPKNTTDWQYGDGKPPMQIIAMGKHKIIDELKDIFKVGKSFDTPAGQLTVTEFNYYFDPEAGINRFADIKFSLDGQDAGSFVFRASSNDPTWVCSFETPVWEDEAINSSSVDLRYDSVGGLVLDVLEKYEFARVAGEGFEYTNKTDAETTLLRYREGLEEGI